MTTQLTPVQGTDIHKAGQHSSKSLQGCVFEPTGVARLEEIPDVHRPVPEGGFLWFDLTDPSAYDLETLQSRFKLHPLAVEDALHAHQRAKAESYPGFEFVVVHGVSRTEQGTLGVHELNLFIGKDFVISVRHGPSFSIQDLLSRWDRVPEHWRPDPSSLFYVLLDAVVDEYAPFADALEEDLRSVRQRLIRNSSLEAPEMRHIFGLSELAYASHAVAFPLKDVLTTLLRAGPPVVSELEVPYFRDIRDHAEHVIERLALARNGADRAFDIYHALEARAQAKTSRQLAQVATVFLPLTLVTGFFGQNFGVLVSGIAGPRAFWILCVGGEILVAVLTLYFVRRMGRR